MKRIDSRIGLIFGSLCNLRLSSYTCRLNFGWVTVDIMCGSTKIIIVQIDMSFCLQYQLK